MVRWGAGVTLAGFVVGGGLAAIIMTGNSPPAASSVTSDVAATNNAELSTLLSAAGTSDSTTTRPGPLRRIRAIGGYYGSLTFRGGTVAYERGTVESVNHSDMVVRAPDGTTMTWLLVSDTLVRDRGRASTSVLSDGQLVFVGGRMVNGARDARLIVVRTPEPATSEPATPEPATSEPATNPATRPGNSINAS